MSILLALLTALVLMRSHPREAHSPQTGVAGSPTEATDQRQLTTNSITIS